MSIYHLRLISFVTTGEAEKIRVLKTILILFTMLKRYLSLCPPHTQHRLNPSANHLLQTAYGKLPTANCLRKIVYCLLPLAYCLLLPGCVPPEFGKVKHEVVRPDFKDPKVQNIYNLQERQATDSLIRFFKDENPTYRYIAAMAFGSIRDKKALDSLATLLKDEIPDVRAAAAYAIGQIGDPKGEPILLKGFEAFDTIGRFARSNAAIMEAIGKCGSAKTLEALCNIKTFRETDSVLLEGQAYGIYRYGLRDTTSQQAIQKMLAFLEKPAIPQYIRLIAASYLGRIKIKYDTSTIVTISQLALTEKKPNIRMALVKALGKAEKPASIALTMESLYRVETDYRVKCNIVNAMTEFPYATADPIISRAVEEPNLHVALTAAQYYLQHGKESEGPHYWRMAKETPADWRLKYALYGAALKWDTWYPKQRDSILNEVKTFYEKATNPFEKAEALKALAQFGSNYDEIIAIALKKDIPLPVRTAAAEAISNIIKTNDYDHIFQGRLIHAKLEMRTAMYEFINSGDPGLMAVAATTIRQPGAEFNKKNLVANVDAIIEAMKKLTLPQELETYDELRQTVNFALDSASAIPKKKYGPIRPIDWRAINGVTDLMRASIKTSRGYIKLQFFTHNAPASVSNFVLLARSGFFNGKPFHRVVPNFVVQTGCPRGDGFGSLDYVIRSELTPLHYQEEGYVGMASAGNHTECSQWFITESPALHLDPNYTIFAKVVEGMNVVHQLHYGDVVETVIIN